MTLHVHLQNAFTADAEQFKLPTRKQFKSWVHTALQFASIEDTKNANIELTIRLINAAESAELNERYRNKTGPTNILSFPMDEVTDEESDCYLGDLAICVSKVFQEAIQQQKKPIAHWAHLTVHGVLHLLGYDHKVEKEAEVMETLETKILHQLGFEDPYD